MIRILPLLLWLVLALFSVGCSGLSKVDVGRVLTSGRDGWQYPERVIDVLALRPGDRVAEIGAGRGYWLPYLSSAVGPTGRVYAVEVDLDLVEQLQANVLEQGLGNVEVILGVVDDPRLPVGEIDLAMTCLTYHHIEDRVAYFERLQSSLRDGGRVVHLDDRPDAEPPISWFQGEGHWTDPAEIEAEMHSAGYITTGTHDFLPAQSFLVFEPRMTQQAARVLDWLAALALPRWGRDS